MAYVTTESNLEKRATKRRAPQTWDDFALDSQPQPRPPTPVTPQDPLATQPQPRPPIPVTPELPNYPSVSQPQPRPPTPTTPEMPRLPIRNDWTGYPHADPNFPTGGGYTGAAGSAALPDLNAVFGNAPAASVSTRTASTPQPTPPTPTTPQTPTTPKASTKPPAVLSGWEASKWNDPTHQSPKYVVGRILAKYKPSVQGLKQAMAEIQASYPGTTWNGKDIITIPGLGPIDVGGSFSTNDPSQMKWWWGAPEGAPDWNGALPATAGTDISYSPQPTPPTMTTPARVPATDPYTDLFWTWYGVDPTAAQVADYTRQGQSWDGAIQQVLQNLYQESPAYSPQLPTYQAWQAAHPTTPAPTTPRDPTVITLDPWFEQNPFPDGGTKAQQDAWMKEAKKHGYTGGTTGTATPRSTTWGTGLNTGTGAGTGAGTGTGTGTGYASGMPGADASVFDDPTTAQYMGILNQRLEELFTPLISGQRSSLEALMGQQRDASKPDLDALLDFARGRFESLQGPALTPQEQELMKTAIADPIQVEAAAQKQRALERASARGMAPTSGLAEMDTRDIEQAAASQMAQGDRALALDWLDRGEARQSQAGQIGALIPQLQSEDLAARAAAGAQLLSLEQAFQQQEEQRRNYGTQLAEQLATLPERRLTLASQVNSGGQTQLPDLFNSILSLAQIGQQDEQFNRGQSAQTGTAIGQILAMIAMAAL